MNALHTTEHTDSPEAEVRKEWRWVNKLPGYTGEYASQIDEMAIEFQQAVNLEIEAGRIQQGQEKGSDNTFDVTPQDHLEADSLKAQALDMRLHTVEQAKQLYLSINKRWLPKQIEEARGVEHTKQTPAPSLHRDRVR